MTCAKLNQDGLTNYLGCQLRPAEDAGSPEVEHPRSSYVPQLRRQRQHAL